MDDFRVSLEQRFPEMRLISSPPPLASINGIGATVYGSRDFDRETGTYVTTHFFTVVFVPVFALGAYRVADAPQGGWYFIGKVPLSSMARAWNFLVCFGVLALIGGFGWHHHTHTPEYIASREISRGDAMLAEGKLRQACDHYQAAAIHAPFDSQAGMRQILNAPLDAISPEDAASAWQGLATANRLRPIQEFVPRTIERALQVADTRPAVGLKLLQVVNETDPKAPKLAAAHALVIDKAFQLEPNDPDIASEMALVLEAKQDRAKCDTILTPLTDQLGNREGARILGQIRVHEGKFDEAYALLSPYLEANLQAFQNAEAEAKDAEEALLTPLKNGAARDFDFQRYDKLSVQAQDEMVRDYITTKTRTDPRLASAIAKIRRLSGVISAALDYGVVQLRRAQNMSDVAARNAELQKAEKTFLAIQGTAGRDADFKLTLGQVYYWMGKQTQGGKLLDEVQVTNSFEVRLALAHVLRELGEASKCIKLLEGMYEKETHPKNRSSLASTRVLLCEGLDDKIEWLGKCDQALPNIRAQLCESRGLRAMFDGNDAEAAKEFRQGIAHWDALPETTATLNNSALMYIELAGVEGNAEHLKEALKRLEKAIRTRPRDSIVLQNGADGILSHGLGEVIGNAIDRKIVRTRGNFNELVYLYRDGQSRDVLVEKLRANPSIKQARDYYERALILAPKSPLNYTILSRLYGSLDDLAAMERLAKQLEATQVDRRPSKMDDPVEVEKSKKEFKRIISRDAKTVDEARHVGGATFSYAASTLIHDSLGMKSLFPDELVDVDALIKLCDEARRAAPSYGIELEAAALRLQRAHDNLLATDPDYRAAVEPAKNKVASPILIAWVVSRGGARGNAVAKNADVEAARKILIEQAQAMDGFKAEWTWALCRDAIPDRGQSLLEKTRKRIELNEAFDRIILADSAAVIDRVLRDEMNGKDGRAYFDEKKAAHLALPNW